MATASAEQEINEAAGKLLWPRGDAPGTHAIRPFAQLGHGMQMLSIVSAC
jgi:hypothetical protein